VEDSNSMSSSTAGSSAQTISRRDWSARRVSRRKVAFQSANRGEGDDAVADMVELHNQDPAMEACGRTGWPAQCTSAASHSNE